MHHSPGFASSQSTKIFNYELALRMRWVLARKRQRALCIGILLD